MSGTNKHSHVHTDIATNKLNWPLADSANLQQARGCQEESSEVAKVSKLQEIGAGFFFILLLKYRRKNKHRNKSGKGVSEIG